MLYQLVFIYLSDTPSTMRAPIEVNEFQETNEFSDFLWMAEVEMDDFDKMVNISIYPYYK